MPFLIKKKSCYPVQLLILIGVQTTRVQLLILIGVQTTRVKLSILIGVQTTRVQLLILIGVQTTRNNTYYTDECTKVVNNPISDFGLPHNVCVRIWTRIRPEIQVLAYPDWPISSGFHSEWISGNWISRFGFCFGPTLLWTCFLDGIKFCWICAVTQQYFSDVQWK